MVVNMFVYACSFQRTYGSRELAGCERAVELIAALVHGHEMAPSHLADSRIIKLPGCSVTVADMVAALEKVAGKEVASLVDWSPDPAIIRIVNMDTWHGDFDTRHANAIGFPVVEPFEQIIEAYRAEFVPCV